MYQTPKTSRKRMRCSRFSGTANRTVSWDAPQALCGQRECRCQDSAQCCQWIDFKQVAVIFLSKQWFSGTRNQPQPLLTAAGTAQEWRGVRARLLYVAATWLYFKFLDHLCSFPTPYQLLCTSPHQPSLPLQLFFSYPILSCAQPIHPAVRPATPPPQSAPPSTTRHVIPTPSWPSLPLWAHYPIPIYPAPLCPPH